MPYGFSRTPRQRGYTRRGVSAYGPLGPRFTLVSTSITIQPTAVLPPKSGAAQLRRVFGLARAV